MTVEEFQAKFPEFQGVDAEVIQIFLDDASLCLDPDQFGPKLDMAQGYHTAHHLTLSPFGQAVRINFVKTADKELTCYERPLTNLIRQCSSGGRVT